MWLAIEGSAIVLLNKFVLHGSSVGSLRQFCRRCRCRRRRRTRNMVVQQKARRTAHGSHPHLQRKGFPKDASNDKDARQAPRRLHERKGHGGIDDANPVLGEAFRKSRDGQCYRARCTISVVVIVIVVVVVPSAKSAEGRELLLYISSGCITAEVHEADAVPSSSAVTNTSPRPKPSKVDTGASSNKKAKKLVHME